MKVIEVICGIIIQNRQVLVAQRDFDMSLPYKWEFPGGKKYEWESDAECLERELLEELNIRVSVKQKFASNFHQYETISILLTAYIAEHIEGTILTFEHSRVEWRYKEELLVLEWAAADIPIMMELIHSEYLL